MPAGTKDGASHPFRPLLIFWAIIVLVLGTGAAVLQRLGPLPLPGETPHPAPSTHVAAVAKPLPAPDAKPPVTPAAPAHPALGPAPEAALTATPIQEPVPALQEAATELPGQMLPRIASDGRRPEQIYAAAFSPAERHPRIALILDGVGLDTALSGKAMDTLPAAIDFAYSAYTPPATAAALAQSGRRHGRECLVSIPMEPTGYPLIEEGTLALLTGADPEINRQNMQAALAHVQGCVGATAGSDGMAGERFAEMHQAFGDVMLELAQRGLLYLDPRPGAPPPADATPGARLPRVVDVVVDRGTDATTTATAEQIDAHLAALEHEAAEHGTAIGLAGPPRPVLLERLAVWSNALAARGLVLAPLTAIPAPRPDVPR